MKSRLKEIAELADVSVATVSNVLNGRKNVGQATRERVLKICMEKGYYSSSSNKAVSSSTVMFIFSDFDREYYLQIIKGINHCLTENGYDLVICTNKSSQKFMRNNFACGMICLDRHMSDEVLIEYAKPHFPVVLMDRMIAHDYANTKSVVVDNYPVMCEMVQGLVDKGYRKFGYIGGVDFTLDHKERFAAFTDTLHHNGLTFDSRHYFHGDYSETSGYQAAKLIILSNELPEVLVCANDHMALGAFKAFEENKIKVPEDIAVTGFDNTDAAMMAGLTTIAIPRYECGYLAAKELLTMIRGQANREPVKLNATIQWRKTTK
ncbi:LacI family DNA-binding transcriptional regulator [Paenibacillus dendritiformis]|uniref:LacI family DNA-binding transcriptional regulator n=1 Tax=Paenibacillus dendritiformis TaxID=130049 RepID=UPI00105AAEA5|nr:LacI family DNA-binding transcriptional regulator [Paenibacillus dendritiformis]TDL51694.1 LacI family transcriptional regulator [Paenibacillus dendritiformis]WGU93644.1 LacI family DNA-binding transcriptional regulator [Paenibacillus dendritiformis]